MDVNNTSATPLAPDMTELSQTPAAQRMRKLRQSMTPEEKSVAKKKNAEYMRAYRKKMSPEQKAAASKQGVIRMRESRERQKKQPVSLPPVRTRKALKEHQDKKEKLRLYQREYKRRWREKQNAQKKRRLREKDRKQKQDQRKKEKSENSKSTKTMGSRKQADVDMPFNSEAAARKAVSRVRLSFPKNNPQKKYILKRTLGSSPGTKSWMPSEDILKELVRTAEPREKKKLLSTISQKVPTGKKKEVSELLNVRYKTLLNKEGIKERKVRKDAISKETKVSIRKFYEKPQVSTSLPGRKSVSKKTGKQSQILQRSLRETYRKYLSEGGTWISFSQFAKQRPKHVKPQSKATLRQCFCVYCSNIENKLKMWNTKLCQFGKQEHQLKNKFRLVESTMCPRGDQPWNSLPCVDRLCEECPAIDLHSVFSGEELQAPTGWVRWEMSLPKDGKEGDAKRMLPQPKDGTLAQMVEELEDELKPFSNHIHTAYWQMDKFTSILDNLPKTTALLVMDFSENYTCEFQHAVQGAHWFKPQVTLFPAVAYYWLDGKMMHEALDFVSDDKTHDYNAVFAFTNTIRDHLVQTRKLALTNIIQFTDGASCQFKCRASLADLSQGLSFGSSHVRVQRNYFGSCHGKGPSDGEGGTLKNRVRTAVKSLPTVHISCAEEFYNFAVTNLARRSPDKEGFMRTFFLSKDVNRIRPETKVKPVKGIRKIHSVHSVRSGTVVMRRLTCDCNVCILGYPELCQEKNTELLTTTLKRVDGLELGQYFFTVAYCLFH